MSTLTHGPRSLRPAPARKASAGSRIRVAALLAALLLDAAAMLLISNHHLPFAVAGAALATLAWFATQPRADRPSARTRREDYR